MNASQNPLAKRPFIWSGVALALAFAVAAGALRRGASYPLCRNDETNWAYIAGQLDRGVDWPLSGPVFIGAVRQLSQHWGTAHPVTLAWLGVAGVFVSICVLLWGYRRIGLARPGACLVALGTTSYFWAPLLEARPQQWGQVLVLAGGICAWLWLHRRGGWAIFALLVLAAFTHILSHAILVVVCVTLSLADWAEGRRFTVRQGALLAALGASVAIYAWPGGPYARMLDDLRHNHLPRLLVLAPWLVLAALTLVLTIAFTWRRWHWRAQWSSAAAALLARRQGLVWLLLAGLAVAALALQASMLPAAAWAPYGGSAWRFALFQTGNVLFAALLVAGLFCLVRRLRSGAGDALMARFALWSLIAFALLAAFAVAGSRWLLDTNWFLRVLNYGVPFCAPLAALGLAQVMSHRHLRWLMPPLVALASGVSIISVLRPPGLLAC